MRYWAHGSKDEAAHLLHVLVRRLSLEQQVKVLLFEKEARAAADDAYIVDRLRERLAVLKECRSEEARRENGIVLAAAAPPRCGTP